MAKKKNKDQPNTPQPKPVHEWPTVKSTDMFERFAVQLVRARAARTAEEQEEDRDEQVRRLDNERIGEATRRSPGRPTKVTDEILALDYLKLQQQHPGKKQRTLYTTLADLHGLKWRTVSHRLQAWRRKHQV